MAHQALCHDPMWQKEALAWSDRPSSAHKMKILLLLAEKVAKKTQQNKSERCSLLQAIVKDNYRITFKEMRSLNTQWKFGFKRKGGKPLTTTLERLKQCYLMCIDKHKQLKEITPTPEGSELWSIMSDLHVDANLEAENVITT